MRREGEGWSYIGVVYPGRPRGGATGPPAALVGRAHWSPEGGGDRPPLFFFSRDFVANLKKKNYTLACRPMGERPGYIFEIFQNGHIFLKF